MSLQTISDRTRAVQGPWLIHCLVLTPRDYASLWRFRKPSNLFGLLSNPCDHAGQQMSASQALFLPHRLRCRPEGGRCETAEILLDGSIFYT